MRIWLLAFGLVYFVMACRSTPLPVGAQGAIDMARVPVDGGTITSFGDMSYSGPGPGGGADLAPFQRGAYDLAWGSCAGTPLANTCVEKFFQPFASCFNPAGKCSGGGQQDPHTDWSNGAHMVTQAFPNQGATQYFMGPLAGTHTTCLTWYPAGNQSGQSQLSVDLYCIGSDTSCNHNGTVDANGAEYDSNTHIFTCPDGTKVDVSPNFGECPLLMELLGANGYLCQ